MYLKLCITSRTLLLAGVFAGMALAATSSPAQNSPDGDPPPGAARLAHVEGNVSIQPNGVDSWGQAGDNQPIGAGDRFYTDQSAKAEVQTGRVRAYLGANTDLTLVNQNDQGLELGIAQGTANIYSDGFDQGQSLFISTPNGGVTLVGRGNFRLDVYPDQQSTVITNGQGEQLQLNGAGNFSLNLEPTQSVQLSGTNPVYSQFLQPQADDEFAHWSGGLESHRFNSRSSRYVSPDMVGYDELDDNGDWQPESDYGPIWFPRVDAGWAPYHNGHWVNRPYYGWTWVEDESWGAAPFHYGRWVQMRGRWGWIPGPREVRPVWSPAQVVFAGGIHIGGIGVSVWFPLGPGEAYHPWYNASPAYVNRINQTNIRETKIVHIQNTYVNNTVINNTTINNVTYVNRGAATGVRQDDFAAGRNVRAVAVKVDPKQIQRVQVARPEAPAPPRPVILRPVAKPVAVQAARPVLINNKGQEAAAAPNARPVVVPVRPNPPATIKPLPGRAPIGTPAVGGRPMPPSAGTRPAPVVAPVAVPSQGRSPVPPAGSNINKATPVQPTPGRPVPLQPVPAQPAQGRPAPDRPVPPTQALPNRPLPTAPTPPTGPAQRPVPPAAIPSTPRDVTPPPAVRPVQPPQAVRPQPVVPEVKPIPPATRPAVPETRPTPPAPRPIPPDARPVAPQTRPQPPAARPAPPPTQRPTPPVREVKPNREEKRTPPKKPE